jgi:RHS repeat-associated protein
MPVLKRSEGTYAGGVTYTWDDAGNLLNDGVNTYTYNHANRLTMVDGPPEESTRGQASSIVIFTYNPRSFAAGAGALGDRLTDSIDGVTIAFLLDFNSGLTQVLAEDTHIYLYGVGRIAQVSGEESVVYFLGDPRGFASRAGALGSVRLLTDGEGIVVLAQSYEPYGSVLNTAGEDVTKYGFTGEWQENGLVFLRSRYYGEDMGRFLNRDTWEGDANHPFSYNAYLYTSANPIRFTDPSGLKGEINCSTIPPWLWKDIPGCPGYIPNPKVDKKHPEMYPVGISFWGMNVVKPSMVGDTQKDILDPATGKIVHWGSNLCGQVSIAAIIETITGDPKTLLYIYEGLNKTQEKTFGWQLARVAAQILPEGYTIIIHSCRDHTIYRSGASCTQKSCNGEKITSDYFASWDNTKDWVGTDIATKLMERLKNQAYLVILATSVNSYDPKDDYYYTINGFLTSRTDNHGFKDLTPYMQDSNNGHWIVVTGFSSSWDYGNPDSNLNWVRIWNPYYARTVFYTFNDFRSSINAARAVIEIQREDCRENTKI